METDQRFFVFGNGSGWDDDDAFPVLDQMAISHDYCGPFVPIEENLRLHDVKNRFDGDFHRIKGFHDGRKLLLDLIFQGRGRNEGATLIETGTFRIIPAVWEKPSCTMALI